MRRWQVNALVTAAMTDGWEDVRHKIARIFGRGRSEPQIERRFDATRAILTAAGLPQVSGKARADQVASWTARLLVFREDHPDASAELDALVKEINASARVAADHSVATGRGCEPHGQQRRCGGGCDRRGRNHGPYQAGPGVQLAGSGIAGQFGPGAAASVGGPAIG